jgi:hypothetical protein
VFSQSIFLSVLVRTICLFLKPCNPYCLVPESCDKAQLPNIANGYKTACPGHMDSVYRYSCKKGYRLLGVSTVFCTAAGWSEGEDPVCASKEIIGFDGLLLILGDLETGCDKHELMGDGLEYGRARYAFGGTVVR